MYERSYTDEQLASAVASARSWRGVLRALDLKATSAKAVRSAQRHANRLNLSTAHFTGQRRWTETELRDAIATKSTWVEVAAAVGLVPGGGATTALSAHAVRLDIPTGHLVSERPAPTRTTEVASPDVTKLRDAGALYAATYFTLRGAHVLWPLEPCRYDLAVEKDGKLDRIQVKTTVHTGGEALVTISTSRRKGRALYGPNEIDSFFIIDALLDVYLVPYDVVAGFTMLKLSHYVNFKVVEKGALLSGVSSP